jgi:PKHD-type hydroxylase
MAHILSGLLSEGELQALRAALAGAEWKDGRATAGPQSASVKANHQLAPDDPVAREWGSRIVQALGRHQGFFAAALPHRLSAPLFSRYRAGESYGLHIDNALRTEAGGRMRTDLAATLFLSAPDSYAGGELVIETEFGQPRVRLAAGQMVLYPADSRHRVAEVTRGERLAVVFWVQSMVPDARTRALLLELDRSVQALKRDLAPDHPELLALTGVYHSLLRRWAQV